MLAGTVTISPSPSRCPVRAWRAVDVWDSERVLFIAYDGPTPHTLMAQITEVGGTMVDQLGLLTPDSATAWTRIGGRYPHALDRPWRVRGSRRSRRGPGDDGHDLAPPR